jgi:hypothetical protein
VNDVGEPCAGEPHARFDAAAGGNPGPVGHAARSRTPPADPTHRARGGQLSGVTWLLLQAGERPKEKPLGRGRTGDDAAASAASRASASTGSFAVELVAPRPIGDRFRAERVSAGPSAQTRVRGIGGARSARFGDHCGGEPRSLARPADAPRQARPWLSAPSVSACRVGRSRKDAIPTPPRVPLAAAASHQYHRGRPAPREAPLSGRMQR